MKIRYSADGMHLFDRITGTNILLDEITVSDDKYSLAPRQVSIALTNACDLKCQHCYAPKKAATLPYDVLTKWLTELDEYGTLGIGFGGGEPTLYPRFAELCAFVQEETNLALTFTTHGHWLTDQMLSQISDNVNFIRVSMDGVGQTYESIRGKSFPELLAKLEALKKIVPFGVNYLVNEKTLPELDVAAELIERLGAVELLLLPEISTTGTTKVKNYHLEKMKQWLLNYDGSLRLSISEGNEQGLPICDALPTERGLSAYAHIDAMGYMKKSSYETYGLKINDDVIATLKKLTTNQRLMEYII